ncbi:Uncharacterised protein [uncultured archaeon]|nr:Uncharacterised protein [uncultured archaeon]
MLRGCWNLKIGSGIKYQLYQICLVILFRLKDNKLEIEKLPMDSVAIFRKTAKGMGKLKFHPHEAYEEELVERLP